jgi:hypothetical protein
MEGIVLKEETVEDLIAVLLVDVPALELSGLVLHPESQGVLAMLVIDNLPFRYN